MSAAKRRPVASDRSPTGPEERNAILNREFRRDLAYWIGSNPRLALRIMRLIEEVISDPYRGTGKPELLKHDLHGRWSRRITDEHRMLYEVSPSAILFMVARFHYAD